MANDGTDKVKKNINGIYERRAAAVYALAQFFAAEALVEFQNKQLKGKFGEWWTNRTFQAAARFFTKAFKDGESIGFFIAHGVEYGPDLTLDNNREHDAITPLLEKYGRMFIEEVKKLYEG